MKSGSDAAAKRKEVMQCAKKIRHRGPDWNGVYCKGSHVMCHERLSIVDPVSGSQPLYNEDKTVVVAVNGEIYNYQQLKEELKGEHKFSTNSDCEVIVHLYEEMGVDFLNKLTGMFAFVLYDEKKDKFIVARDHIGIIPLYIGRGVDGCFWIASELKAILAVCVTVEEFLPGRVFDSSTGETTQWYTPQWHDVNHVPTTRVDLVELRERFEKAVVSHLMSDVPYGVLLSGGLDSSLVSAIAARHVNNRVMGTEQKDMAWWPKLHSFSVGLEGSPDLAAAQKVADFIGTVHHEFTFTVQQGIDALHDVIYHLETYDVTTIRASTPMYLMSRMIKALGVKMVLSGEGADEIFAGYLYFHKAPSAEELHKETVRKVKDLHLFDCLRANKSTSAWGVEARVPFLDREFVNYAMGLHPEDKLPSKHGIEKWILRKAFEGYLPEEVLWRQKEQFSDGVGYSWIDSLKELASQQISDELFEAAKFRFPIGTPTTKEGYYYRVIFEELFPGEQAARLVPSGPSVACSTAIAVEWDAAFKNNADPSGRAVGVHTDAYKPNAGSDDQVVREEEQKS